MPKEVDKPFAGGRWTAARYSQFIVSALRRAWMKWPVKHDALEAARREATPEDIVQLDLSPRTKWVYRCNSCGKEFAGSRVQVDHKVECGRLVDDPAGYIARMFCEEDGLQVVCKGCHQVKTRNPIKE